MPTTTPTLWNAAVQVNAVDEVNGEPTRQAASKVIGLADGGYVVAWEDDSDRLSLGAPDIIGQRYDALGQKVGDEFFLSTIYNDAAQQNVDLAAFSDGTFLSAYQSTDAAGLGDLENVSVEHYDADASFTALDDFRGPANDQAPTIATFVDGGYALVYQNDESGDDDLTYVHVDAAGNVGAGVTIESAVDASAPEIATLASGNVAVAYQSAAGGGDILLRIVTPSGANVIAKTVANGAAAQTAPVVASLGGSFVVAWADSSADGAGNAGVRFSIYSDAGALTHGPLAGNVTTKAGLQDAPAVTALADGGFMIAWRDGASGDIQGQRFSAAGAAIGGEVTLLGDAVNVYGAPQLALLADGRFVVTADRTDADGDLDVVRAIWDPRDTTISGTNAGDVITSRVDGAAVSGLGGADTIYGVGGADTLDGGAGSDSLSGGFGNDVYFVDNLGDKVIEKNAQGIDTVNSSMSFSLFGQFIERLTLTGTGDVDATGNSIGNRLVGNSGDNVLDGKTGADTMTGGRGDDTYYVDNAGDQVIEASGAAAGVDKVFSSVTFSLAGQNVEKLSFTGTGDVDGTGNSLANTIVGNSGKNELNGAAGADTMTGGTGQDRFLFANIIQASNVDHITDFKHGVDKIVLDQSFFTNLNLGGLSASAFKNVALAAPDVDDRIIYNSNTGELFYDPDGVDGVPRRLFAVLDDHPLNITSTDFTVVA